MSSYNNNIEMVANIAKALEEINDEVVFIGGAVTAFYIDDPAAPEPSPSEDVDCVVKVFTYLEYSKLEEKLRAKKFVDRDNTGEDENAPACRKYYLGAKVDFMPIGKDVLGFGNIWYQDGFKNRKQLDLPSGEKIWIFPLPYFFASKLSAFNDRGRRDDIRFSQDLEDIAQVLDGNVDIKNRLSSGDDKVTAYLKSEFSRWLNDETIMREAVGANLAYSSKKERVDRIFDILKDFCS